MRCTQYIGFGKHNPVNQEELAHLERRVYATDGMFDDIDLGEYCFGGNVIYREIVQYKPWSSGPMLYMALKRMSDGKLFCYWNKNEVDGR